MRRQSVRGGNRFEVELEKAQDEPKAAAAVNRAVLDASEAADEAIFLTEVGGEGERDFGAHFGDDFAGGSSPIEEMDDRTTAVQIGGNGGHVPLVELGQTDGAFEIVGASGFSLHLRCCTHDVYGRQTTVTQVFDSILNLDKLSKVNAWINEYEAV